MSEQLTDPVVRDATDRAILRAIGIAPRVPFRALGEILGKSEQTVARRYRRLERAGVVRATAVASPLALGESNWMVRAQVRPSGAESLARALALRDDVSWVNLLSGGSEVACVVRSRTRQVREELLIQKLPRTAQVLSLQMSVVLHRFVGGSQTDEWTGLKDALDADQYAALAAWAPPPFDDTRRTNLTHEDVPLLSQLARDGRSSYATLAAAAGMTEGRAARRLETLQRDGAVYLDVDLSGPALGFHASALLSMSVSPGQLDAAGHALAAHDESAYVAAVSGPQNLTASVMCRDLQALYEFATRKVGPIPGLQTLDIAPTLRSVKHAGTLGSGDRLAS